jgi:hypothetical protein
VATLHFVEAFCPVQHSLYPDASQSGAHPWSDWELKRVPGQLPSTPSLPFFDRQPIPRCGRSRSPFSVAMTAFEKACRIETPQVTSFIRRWKAEQLTIEVCNVPIINFIYWIGHSSNRWSEAYSWGTMQQIDASQFKYKGRVGHSQLFLPANSTVRMSRRRVPPRSFRVSSVVRQAQLLPIKVTNPSSLPHPHSSIHNQAPASDRCTSNTI